MTLAPEHPATRKPLGLRHLSEGNHAVAAALPGSGDSMYSTTPHTVLDASYSEIPGHGVRLSIIWRVRPIGGNGTIVLRVTIVAMPDVDRSYAIVETSPSTRHVTWARVADESPCEWHGDLPMPRQRWTGRWTELDDAGRAERHGLIDDLAVRLAQRAILIWTA